MAQLQEVLSATMSLFNRDWVTKKFSGESEVSPLAAVVFNRHIEAKLITESITDWSRVVRDVGAGTQESYNLKRAFVLSPHRDTFGIVFPGHDDVRVDAATKQCDHWEIMIKKMVSHVSKTIIIYQSSVEPTIHEQFQELLTETVDPTDDYNNNRLKFIMAKDIPLLYLPEPYLCKTIIDELLKHLPFASNKTSILDLVQKADQVFTLAKLALEVNGVNRDTSNEYMKPSLIKMIDSIQSSILDEATQLTDIKSYLRGWKAEAITPPVFGVVRIYAETWPRGRDRLNVKIRQLEQVKTDYSAKRSAGSHSSNSPNAFYASIPKDVFFTILMVTAFTLTLLSLKFQEITRWIYRVVARHSRIRQSQLLTEVVVEVQEMVKLGVENHFMERQREVRIIALPFKKEIVQNRLLNAFGSMRLLLRHGNHRIIIVQDLHLRQQEFNGLERL